MAGARVEVFTPEGLKVGEFIDPAVAMSADHYYSLSGRFINADGTVAERIPFNPEILPYSADISAVQKCQHVTLVRVYVQRGRQPVQMTGTCSKP